MLSEIKMRLVQYLLISCLCIGFFKAQTQSTRYFKKEIGDPNPFFEAGQSVKTLGDGYLVGAYSVKSNPYDVDAYIIKTDLVGNTIWQTKISDSLSLPIIFSSISDGDYFYFVGEIPDNMTSYNGFLLKSDSSGSIFWQKSIGDSILNNGIYHILKTSDENLIMAGWIQDSSSGNWQGNLIKTDSSGSILWDRTYPGIYNSAITSVLEHPNGNFVLIGRTEFALGSGKVWYLLVDSVGVLINSFSYFVGTPDSNNNFQIASSIDATVDSGYIIGGQGGVDPTLSRGLIFKINSNGLVDWFKMLTANSDGTGNLWRSKIVQVKQLQDSTFICSGYLNPGPQQQFKMILIKLDFNGNELWRRSYNSANGYNTYGYDLDLVSDGGFILTGRAEDSTDADVYLVKTNCLGYTQPPTANYSVIWNGTSATFYNLSGSADTCIYYFGDGDSAIVHLADTLPFVHQYSGAGPYQTSLLALACGESDTIYQTIFTGIDESYSLLKKTFLIFPNPANEKITVSFIFPKSEKKINLILQDLAGKIIASKQLSTDLKEQELDISFLNSGSYQVSLEYNGSIFTTRKLVVVK